MWEGSGGEGGGRRACSRVCDESSDLNVFSCQVEDCMECSAAKDVRITDTFHAGTVRGVRSKWSAIVSLGSSKKWRQTSHDKQFLCVFGRCYTTSTGLVNVFLRNFDEAREMIRERKQIT